MVRTAEREPTDLDPRRAQRVLGRPPRTSSPIKPHTERPRTRALTLRDERGLPDRHARHPASARHAEPQNSRRRAMEPGRAKGHARRTAGLGRCLGWRCVPPLRLRHQAPGSGPRGGPHLPALRQHHAVGARAAGQAVHGVLRADRPVGTPAARGLRDLRHRRRGLSTVASSPVVGRPGPWPPDVRDRHIALFGRPEVLAVVDLPNPVPGDGHFSSCPPVAHRRPSDRPLGVAHGQPHRGVHCTLSRSEQGWDPLTTSSPQSRSRGAPGCARVL